MFIDKLEFRPMVDAKEALALADYRTIGDFELIEAIAREYAKQNPRPRNTSPGAIRVYSVLLYQALFNAGRVQGIREERAKRRREDPTEHRQ